MLVSGFEKQLSSTSLYKSAFIKFEKYFQAFQKYFQTGSEAVLNELRIALSLQKEKRKEKREENL